MPSNYLSSWYGTALHMGLGPLLGLIRICTLENWINQPQLKATWEGLEAFWDLGQELINQRTVTYFCLHTNVHLLDFLYNYLGKYVCKSADVQPLLICCKPTNIINFFTFSGCSQTTLTSFLDFFDHLPPMLTFLPSYKQWQKVDIF